MPHPIAALGLVVAMLAMPLAATPQQAAKILRIGFVGSMGSFSGPTPASFIDGMRGHGYVEGRDYAVEYRSTGGIRNALRRSAPSWRSCRSTSFLRACVGRR